MIEYLNFFLYNNIFEAIIVIPFFINIILINYFDNLQNKKENTEENFQENRKKKLTQDNKIHNYKIIILLITSIVVTIYSILKYKEIILAILLIVLPLYTLIKTVINTYNNKNDFSLENKYISITSTSIFIIFFSSYVTPIYLESFMNIAHIYKELLFILYIIFKITLFGFLTSTNIFVLISNINSYLKHKNKKSISKYFIHKKKTFYFINYNFPLYRKFKTKLTRIIDIIIFTLLSVPTIILNIIIIFFLHLIKVLKNKLYNLFKNLEKKEEWNKIIKKVTSIFAILAFIIVYIIMIIFKENFHVEVFEIYTFIATVILIPLIYDSIKSKN